MFETKDSGVREEFESGMVRDTQEGKARFDLLFPLGIPYAKQMLTRAANLMERGMSKYGERNWEKANSQAELDRAKASALRHMVQWIGGESDEDHAAAVIFNLIAAETIALKVEKPVVGSYAPCWCGPDNPHREGLDRLGVHWNDDRPSPANPPKNLEAEFTGVCKDCGESSYSLRHGPVEPLCYYPGDHHEFR